MSFIVNKQLLATNSVLASQYAEIGDLRYNANVANAALVQGRVGRAANAAEMDPRLWSEVDAQTQQLLLADSGANRLLTDLMPLARSVHIGVLATMYRQFGADFEAQTSLDGQHRKPMDRGSYDYDGTLVLVHTSQFGQQWRELEGARRIGFDMIADDQAASVRAVRTKTVDMYLNGVDVTYRGVGAFGIRNSPNVQAINLGAGGIDFDFTDPAATFDETWAAVAQLLEELHGPNNNAIGDVTLYVSSAIMANWNRAGVTQGSLETFAQALTRMNGIDKIERLQELSGNELIGIIRDTQYIRPVVGMPINTVPMERKTPMDDYQYLTWTANGLEIRADVEGRSGVFYAAAG